MKRVLALAMVAFLVVSSTGFTLAQEPAPPEEPTAADLANARGFDPGDGVEARALQMDEALQGEPVEDCSLLAIQPEDTVVAWEVSRDANPADYGTVIADLRDPLKHGLTVCTIDMAQVGIPADIDILVITSYALGRGNDGCLNHPVPSPLGPNQYTAEQADQIWDAVTAGMGLLLLNENAYCGWGTRLVATRLGVIPAGNQWSYTFLAGRDYDPNNPAALFNGVTSWEVDWATSYSSIYPPAQAVAWNGAGQSAMVTKQQHDGCAVIVGDSNWFANYPSGTNPIPFIERLDARTLANNAFGYLKPYAQLWANPARWIRGRGNIASAEAAAAGVPEGEASFAFDAKYKKVVTELEGQASFVDDAAGVVFESSVIEGLRTGGNRARLEGIGTINGALAPNGDAYKFIIWASDGEPDNFRIRIWYEVEELGKIKVIKVYDNDIDGCTDPAITKGGIAIRGK